MMAGAVTAAAIAATAAGTIAAATVLVLPGIAGSATTTTTAAPTTTSTTSAATRPAGAKSLLAASLAAARSQRTVHFSATSTVGSESITIVADVAAAKGQEAITVTSGGQTGHVSARLVKKVAYFRGDAAGLERYLGLPSTLAPKYANRWISFEPSDQYYKTVSQAMTISSAVGQISVKAPTSTGPSSPVNGTAAIGITGTTTSLGSKGPAVLYVPAQGSLLPLRYTGQGKEQKQKATGQVDFSHWGESFSVVAPAKAVRSSSV
ncbi:MAG TPA: hypothetical protein VHX40_03545 [Acidimicrobiales bacterium]|nr:hypothetical protein [Acidimicrobiales bacterium]